MEVWKRYFIDGGERFAKNITPISTPCRKVGKGVIFKRIRLWLKKKFSYFLTDR